MQFFKYISSLLPSFSRDRILEDCRLTRTEITEETLPAYANALVILKGWKFKSDEIVMYQTQFNTLLATKNRNMFVTIHDSFKEIIQNLTDIEKLIDQTYNQEVASQGLTYLKANQLQFVEACGFVSKFSRKLLNYTLICETKSLDDASPEIAESISKAESDWLRANFVSFTTAFSIVSSSAALVKKSLEAVPDITITSENIHTLPQTLGEKKIDPFMMRLIPIWMNPIYHLGLMVAEWQAERYHAAKEERRLIELRLLNMKMLQEGKPDARTQKMIEYNQERVRALNRAIAKMEEKHV